MFTLVRSNPRDPAISRDALQRATKRAYRSARASGKPIGWREARRRGKTWCLAMDLRTVSA